MILLNKLNKTLLKSLDKQIKKNNTEKDIFLPQTLSEKFYITRYEYKIWA